MAYEAAIEAINNVVSAYTALIESDPEHAADYRAERAACQRHRETLNAATGEEITRVRSTYADRLRMLQGGR